MWCAPSNEQRVANMGTEIERKFLVAGNQWRTRVERRVRIRQGYLSTDIRCAIRVRIAGDSAWITVKGKPIGIVRSEYEYTIPAPDAEQMLDNLCTGVVVEKTRATVREGDHEWVVDEFSGKNHGLIMAEIELDDEGESFRLPDWAGQEVTGDHRYDNSQLALKPFTRW